jgi:hypothetical protein
MADNCKGCGAEIFAGQRFCRMCGRATGDLADEHAPTQNMPPPDEGPYPGYQGGRQGPAATAPAQRPNTAPVYPAQQQPVYYQGGPGYAMYPPQPAKGGFKWGWVFAFIGIGLFSAIVFVILLVAARRHQLRTPFPPPVQSVQTAPGPNETVMDESRALVTSNQTIITQSYPLTSGASLSIKNTNGRIHIESWDGPGLEVKVTKSEGNEVSRRRVPIYQQLSGNRLSLRAGDTRGVDVAYEVKVPKQMGNVELVSVNGAVKVDSVTGNIDVSSTNGNVDLSSIDGSASVRNTNGSISALFEDVNSGRPMAFSNTNGSIKLLFRSDVNAELRASTKSGSINLDSEWGIDVKKSFPIGASAEGIMGTGGPALKVETMNGSISIMKAPGSPGH